MIKDDYYIIKAPTYTHFCKICNDFGFDKNQSTVIHYNNIDLSSNRFKFINLIGKAAIYDEHGCNGSVDIIEWFRQEQIKMNQQEIESYNRLKDYKGRS